MNLNRTLMKDLFLWKNDMGRKPLIIRGARQVGKTNLTRQFGNQYFKSLIDINLEKPEHLKIFGNVESIEDFEKKVQLFFHQSLIPGETLLFIDEIQESSNLLTMLRFFAEERPSLHVIAAGSLLEAVIGKGWSIPVGRVDYRFLYPLTYFEFLQAIGQNELFQNLDKIDLKVDQVVHEQATKYFREYLITGGLPEIVVKYADSHDFLALRPIYDRLQLSYLDDVKKYTSTSTAVYVQAMLTYGPKRAGELIVFENFMDLGYRSREIAEAATLIEKIMILNQILSINSTVIPLTPKIKRSRKLIWLDVGLVNSVNDTYSELASHEYSGKLLEQVVGQTLIASQSNNKKPNIYYWSRNRDEGSAEVDFCYQLKEKIIAVEVKSGQYYQMRSLMSLAEISPDTVLVRTSFDPIGTEVWQSNNQKHQVLSVPVYMLERLNQIVETQLK